MMRILALFLGLLVIGGIAFGQPPPTGLNATRDDLGHVDLTWHAPVVNGSGNWMGLVDWPESESERLEWTEPDFAKIREQWEAQQHSRNELDNLEFYFVYRNGVQIGIAYDTSFDDELPQYGSYIYSVTAFYDEGESAHSNEYAVVWYDMVSFAIDEDFDDGSLPDGWVVEATVVSHTWYVTDYHNLFDTPYALVDSDAAGSNPNVHLQERLIMPAFDFTETSFVQLGYSTSFVEWVNEHGYVQYRIANGPWQTIADYSDDGTILDVQHDLTVELAGEADAEISFYYDDFSNWGFYWGIDDVTVFREVVEDPVVFDLIGMRTHVPAEGGIVGYDVGLTSNIPNAAQDVKFWTKITQPNGTTSGPLLVYLFNLTPFMERFVSPIQQEVPPDAPAGMYIYHGYVGLSINNPLLEDSFTFTKAGAGDPDGDGYVIDPADWPAHGFEISADAAGASREIPQNFSLDIAWPNPFNAITTVTLNLPESSSVKVIVYNIAGQKVATLADSRFEAGVYHLSFDGVELASGTYFVRAIVPGRSSQVRKIVLLK